MFLGFADAADQKATLSALHFLDNGYYSVAKETGLLFFPYCVQKFLLESVKLKLPLNLQKHYGGFFLIAWLVLNALFVVEYFIDIHMFSSSVLFLASQMS